MKRLTRMLALLLAVFLFYLLHYPVSIKVEGEGSNWVQLILWHVPWQSDVLQNLKVEAQIPDSKLTLKREKTGWLSSEITIEEHGNTGQRIRIINKQGVGGWTAKTLDWSYQFKTIPHFEQVTFANELAPSGPVEIRFRTMMKKESIEKFIAMPTKGKWSPINREVAGRKYTDFRTWQFRPLQPLKEGQRIKIVLGRGLLSQGGLGLAKEKVIYCQSGSYAYWEGAELSQNAIDLYPTFQLNASHRLGKVQAKLVFLGGEIETLTKIQGGNLQINPHRVLLPDTEYTLVVKAQAFNAGELPTYRKRFRTHAMEQWWVDVDLGCLHTMRVYEGRKLVRMILVSGGKEGQETPYGTYFTGDRGLSFWSPRFGEGATHWVRLKDQYLIHSVPKNSNWHTIEEEHLKLGTPASHGCVRLDEIDAKWFYNRVPKGTLVIIHP